MPSLDSFIYDYLLWWILGMIFKNKQTIWPPHYSECYRIHSFSNSTSCFCLYFFTVFNLAHVHVSAAQIKHWRALCLPHSWVFKISVFYTNEGGADILFMSAIPACLKCDFSSDFTVIIQQYYQSADKLRFVGSGLWRQHLGDEPSHFLASFIFCTGVATRPAYLTHWFWERGGSCRCCSSVYCKPRQWNWKKRMTAQLYSRLRWLKFGTFHQDRETSCFLSFRCIYLKGIHASPLTHDACVAPVWVPYIPCWGSCHRVVTSFWHQSTKGLCLAAAHCWLCEGSIFLW